jgi:hypothetical protein
VATGRSGAPAGVLAGRNPLEELLLVAFAGVASGAEDWVSVAEWGQIKLDWLRRFLPLADCLARHLCDGPTYTYPPHGGVDAHLRVMAICAFRSQDERHTFRSSP